MNMQNLIIPLMGLVCCSVYANQYDAVVVPHKDGQNNHYTQIARAVAAAKSSGKDHYKIFIKNGVYTEKFQIKVPGVELIGQDRDKTILQYNAAAGMKGADGRKWGTTGSYVLRVSADNVTIRNLTIKNSFDFPSNDVKDKSDPTKVRSSQAVAFEINNHVQHAKIENVVLGGYQDTLFVKAGSTSYFKDCVVAGNVDFIFGGGTAVFDHCKIIARKRNRPMKVMGYITAPSTDISQPYGLVFIHSKLVKEAGVPKGSFGLGRPWHPTRTFDDGRYADPNAIGATLYIDSYLGDHLYGWDKMSGWTKDHQRQWFSPDKDARFLGYHNYGPGASAIKDKHKLNERQGQEITIDKILGGDWYKS